MQARGVGSRSRARKRREGRAGCVWELLFSFFSNFLFSVTFPHAERTPRRMRSLRPARPRGVGPGGCQGRPHSLGTPRSRGRGLADPSPPSSRSGWLWLLFVGAVAAADWAKTSFARSARRHAPSAGPRPPPGREQRGTRRGAREGPASASASRRARPERRAAMIPEERPDGPGAGEESARLQEAGSVRQVGASAGAGVSGRRGPGPPASFCPPPAAGGRGTAESALASQV